MSRSFTTNDISMIDGSSQAASWGLHKTSLGLGLGPRHMAIAAAGLPLTGAGASSSSTPSSASATATEDTGLGLQGAAAASSTPLSSASAALLSTASASTGSASMHQHAASSASAASAASAIARSAVTSGSGGSSGGGSMLSSVQAAIRKEGKTVLAMVGLPARGKTFMARRLKRHLDWMGYRTEIFNVGNYRRQHLGSSQSADFFDPDNAEAVAQRNEMARLAFEDMVGQFGKDVIDIAVFDATNTSRERRDWLRNALSGAEKGTPGLRCQLVFIESVCTDGAVIRANVRETKLKSPDYQNVPETQAVKDFLLRIQMYEKVYETIDDAHEGDSAYIKLVDVGRQVIANRINGFLNSRVCFFLSNLNVASRPIWLTRHGESQFNVQGRIGGDSLLSPRGQSYAQRLAAFINKVYPPGTDLTVWTSTLRRTAMTAAPLGREIVQYKALDEIDAGVCDGMTYEAIAAAMPEEYAARARNKFTYRYPRGESYQDIVQRLEPVIIDLMRQKGPVLIVSHQATLRVLYAYLTDRPPETCPDALLPLHTIIQLTPKAYGCEEVRHELLTGGSNH
jgi:broad specificity phosphatase PhoE/predicted kinase